MKNTDNPIRDAMKVAGGQSKLAALLGVTPQAVRKYERGWDSGRCSALPAERAIQIESAVGVPRHRLRPDLWSFVPEKKHPRRRATDCTEELPDEAA